MYLFHPLLSETRGSTINNYSTTDAYHLLSGLCISEPTIFGTGSGTHYSYARVHEGNHSEKYRRAGTERTWE